MKEAQTSITVDGMSHSSEEIIKIALERINGVERVIIDIENKKVFIEYDDEKIDEQIIKETIEDEGYTIK